jgi:hypothetical protein
MAGLERFTAVELRDCDRCLDWIRKGDRAGRVVGLVGGFPWAVGTVLCPRCADLAEQRHRRKAAAREHARWSTAWPCLTCGVASGRPCLSDVTDGAMTGDETP